MLTNYKDKFIVAPVDLKTKIITPEFSFIPMENDKTKIETVETGILFVRKPSTIKDLFNQK